MWSNSVSTLIAAPSETVYAYLVDFTRHTEWSSNVRTIELISGATGTVGAEYRAHEDAPADITSFARVTALEPSRRIAWESTDKRIFRTAWEFLLAPQDGKTQLTQRVSFYPLNPLAWLLLYGLRVRQVAREDNASLERIRQHLEAA